METSNEDLPPRLAEMFINSTDTLRHREINQKIPETWNDRPPLFEINESPKKSSFLWTAQNNQPAKENAAEQEDPNLLKGVSNTLYVALTHWGISRVSIRFHPFKS